MGDSRSTLDYTWASSFQPPKMKFLKVELTITARGLFFPTRRDVRDSAVDKGALVDVDVI
jgi:hypothetical protein